MASQSVAFCVLYLVFFFWRNPNKRRVLTFFPKRKKMFKIKKKVKKNQTIFCRAKILQKRKSPQKEHFEHKAARIIQSTRTRAGVLGMRER